MATVITIVASYVPFLKEATPWVDLLFGVSLGPGIVIGVGIAIEARTMIAERRNIIVLSTVLVLVAYAIGNILHFGPRA